MKIEDSTPKSYSGKLYLQIPTEEIFSDTITTAWLNDRSEGIINDANSGDELTIWIFSDYSNAFKSIVEIQKKDYPFRLMGENQLFFMAYKW